MINVKVSIDRLIVTPLTNRLIISDSVGFVYADFIFDDEWQNLTKTATFSAGDEAYDVLLNGNRCEIPHELLTDGAEIRIAVKGYAEDVIVVTKAMNSAIKVWAAGTHEGTQPGAYTPELWEQVLQNLESKQNTLVAGQNITLEEQTDGTVKISATGGGGGSSEAADIHIEDEEDYYSSNNVEGALSEIGENLYEIGADVESLNRAVAEKQDKIDDIVEIRNNALSGKAAYTKATNTEALISPQATSANKLVSASEMGDAISSVEAKQLYKTASQGSFATKAELTSATVFYNADGSVATPTKNDVAYVLSDESHDGKLAKYVVASVNPTVWGFVISISETSFTQAQNDAINSGITSTKRSGYDTHVSNGDIHVTTTEKSTWDGKYTKPSTGIPASDLASGVIPTVPTALSQLTADSTHRTVTDTEKTTWDGKQNAISDLSTIRIGAAAGATIHNDYWCTIPPKIYVRTGKAIKLFFRNLMTENYRLNFGAYSASADMRTLDDYISISGTAAGQKAVTYSTYDNHHNLMETGTATVIVTSNIPANQSVLLIGDSTVEQSNMLPTYLWQCFNADGRTVTLLGHKGTGNYKHEGYSGWKFTDFMNSAKSGVANAFYNPTSGKFDFAYYMTQQGYSSVDKVVIQAGTNDASATTVGQDLTDSLNALATTINSIHSYNANIKIILNLPMMPTMICENFAEKYQGTGYDWVLRANEQRLNKAIIDTYKSTSYITINCTNAILDSTEDIRDNVHPTNDGYKMIAEQIYYTISGM